MGSNNWTGLRKRGYSRRDVVLQVLHGPQVLDSYTFLWGCVLVSSTVGLLIAAVYIWLALKGL